MPWDGTTLFVTLFGAGDGTGTPRHVAGGREESIFQPSFSPDGRLTFVSDRSGWWNLDQERGAVIVALCSRHAEFGLPQWVFGMSTYGFVDEETILCVYRVGGIERLARLELQREAPGRSLDAPQQLRRSPRGGPTPASSERLLAAPPAVCRLDLEEGRVEEVCRSFEIDFDPRFPVDARGHRVPLRGRRSADAFLVPTRESAAAGTGGRNVPPLIVKSHGGPTAATSSALELGIVAVLDQPWLRRRRRQLWRQHGIRSRLPRAAPGRWVSSTSTTAPTPPSSPLPRGLPIPSVWR